MTVAVPVYGRTGVVAHATIDAADAEVVRQHRWNRLASNGLVFTNRSGGRRGLLYLHRLIMGEPAGLEVDHQNRDTLDNRRENLRVCLRHENASNRGVPSNNTSGFKGVGRLRNGRWFAQIKRRGKRTHLGCFATAEEAARAYDAAAAEMHGDFALTNGDLGLCAT